MRSVCQINMRDRYSYAGTACNLIGLNIYTEQKMGLALAYGKALRVAPKPDKRRRLYQKFSAPGKYDRKCGTVSLPWEICVSQFKYCLRYKYFIRPFGTPRWEHTRYFFFSGEQHIQRLFVWRYLSN